MERNAKFILGTSVLILAVVGIGVYAYLQSREFRAGPMVTITSPDNGSTFTDPAITVSGTAENVAYLSLNDSPIFVNTKGTFTEKLLLLPGYNILSVKARDQFGKTVLKTLELVYKVPTSSTTPTTSSTPLTKESL